MPDNNSDNQAKIDREGSVWEVQRLLDEAQALMYVDDPPGENEIEAYRKITDARAVLENMEEGGFSERFQKQIEKYDEIIAQLTEMLKLVREPPAEEPSGYHHEGQPDSECLPYPAEEPEPVRNPQPYGSEEEGYCYIEKGTSFKSKKPEKEGE